MTWAVVLWGVLAVHSLNCSLTFDSSRKMQQQLSGKYFDIPFDIDPPFSVKNAVGFSGFSVRVLTEVARRGNFTFAITDGGQALAGEERSAVLARLVASSDMFGSYWTDTTERRATGALFSAHYVDVTRVLVTLPDKIIAPPVAEVMFTFLKPFRWDMWVAILVGCLLSAFMNYFFELSIFSGQGKKFKIALAEAKGVRWKTMIPYMFRSFGHFSNSGHTLEAVTVAGRLHNIVWAFLVVIILAAYLANLASFLVIQTKKEPAFQNINAILSAKATLCADPNDGVANLYLRNFPNLKRYPPADATWSPVGSRSSALVNAMRDGLCVGVVLSSSVVDILQKDSSQCDLTKRDPISAPFGAGFGFPIDRCGPFMLAVVDSLLVEMKTDGTLESLWIAEVPPSLCPPKTNFFSPASAEALSVDSFAGLFFIYLSFVIIAVCLRIFRKLCVRAEHEVLTRLSHKEQAVAMAELADTNVPVNSNDSTYLTERVSRIDRAMGEILSTVRHLAHPGTPARAAASTLS